jgi:hypothetical protein
MLTFHLLIWTRLGNHLVCSVLCEDKRSSKNVQKRKRNAESGPANEQMTYERLQKRKGRIAQTGNK